MRKMDGRRRRVFMIFTIGFVLLSQPGFADAAEPLQERSGIITMKGKPVTLVGSEITIGQKAPDFVAQATDMGDVRLSDFKGKIKLIASVPSLDTPVCDMEIHRFNQEAATVARDVVVLFISMDLPFAQKRFCGANGIQNVQTLSDHRRADFGMRYGVLIKEVRLLSRAVFIVDAQNIVRYVEYVQETGTHPDYDKALKVLKETEQQGQTANK